MDKSVPRVTVWHHSAEPRDAKTMTLGTDLSIRTSHSCHILIIFSKCIGASMFHTTFASKFQLTSCANIFHH